MTFVNSPSSHTNSSYSNDTIKKMLVDDSKCDAIGNNDFESSSKATMTSQDIHEIKAHHKELQFAKAGKATSNHSVNSSNNSQSINFPHTTSKATNTSNVPDDWETLADESLDDPTGVDSNTTGKPSPPCPNARPFQPSTFSNSCKVQAAKNSPEFTSNNYSFDNECTVTLIMQDYHPRLAGFLYSLYMSNGPNKFLCHPNQGPFQIDYKDGEFWIVTCTGSNITQILASITDNFPNN